MKKILLFVFGISVALSGVAAVPARLPATYNTGRPRLPHPDASYLSSLAANPAALASYNAATDSWDSTNPANYQQFTVTSTTANFQTGCGGGACRYLSVAGVPYQVTTMTDAHTVVLNPFSSGFPAPSGSGLKLVATSGYQGYQDIEMAMAYDWSYNDLDSATRTRRWSCWKRGSENRTAPAPGWRKKP